METICSLGIRCMSSTSTIWPSAAQHPRGSGLGQQMKDETKNHWLSSSHRYPRAAGDGSDPSWPRYDSRIRELQATETAATIKLNDSSHLHSKLNSRKVNRVRRKWQESHAERGEHPITMTLWVEMCTKRRKMDLDNRKEQSDILIGLLRRCQCQLGGLVEGSCLHGSKSQLRQHSYSRGRRLKAVDDSDKRQESCTSRVLPKDSWPDTRIQCESERRNAMGFGSRTKDTKGAKGAERCHRPRRGRPSDFGLEESLEVHLRRGDHIVAASINLGCFQRSGRRQPSLS